MPRRDGRPTVEEIAAAQQAGGGPSPGPSPGSGPPPEAAAASALTATSSAVASATAAGSGVAGAAALAQAVANAAAGILAAFDRFLRIRLGIAQTEMDQALAEERPALSAADRAAIIAEEVAREKRFAAKARERLAADLPRALAVQDATARADAVQALLDRERRFTQQREQAMRERIIGRAHMAAVRDASPEGAFWRIRPELDNCERCRAMAGKVWPWSVLAIYAPPLHPNCACSLWTIDEARRMGWISDEDFATMDQLPGGDIMEAVAEVLDVDPDDLDGALRLIEAGYDRRYPKGTEKAGEFRPRRGGNPGARLHRPERRHRGAPRVDATPVRAINHEADVEDLNVADLKPGDRVLVNGELDTVREVRSPGLVVLDDMGLVHISRDTIRGVPKAKPEPEPEPEAPRAPAAYEDLERELLTRKMGTLGAEPEDLPVAGFAYLGRGEKVSYQREVRDGVLHLPDGFFRQGRDRREEIVFKHVGRDIGADLTDEERAALGDVDPVAIYAALNSEKARARIEGLAPEAGAAVASAAERQGLPMAPAAHEWLTARAGTSGEPQALQDARALARELGDLDDSTRRATLAERGYGVAGLHMDGGRITGAVYRQPETGAEITLPVRADVGRHAESLVTDGEPTARLNRGGAPDVLDRLREPDALERLAGEGWSWDNAGQDAQGGTWHRLVHPDGRGFEVYEPQAGAFDPERAFTFEPVPDSVASAGRRAIAVDPVTFAPEGMDAGRLDTTLTRSGWRGGPTFKAGDEPDLNRARYTRGDVSIVVTSSPAPDEKVVRVDYAHPAPTTTEETVARLTRGQHDALVAEGKARQAAEDERIRREAEERAKAGAQAGNALESWLVAAQSARAKKPKPPAELIEALSQGNGRDAVKALEAQGWEVVSAGRGKIDGKPGQRYKLRKSDGPGAGSTIVIRSGALFTDQRVKKVEITPNPQRGRRDRLPAGQVWKNHEELYVDALGRADELARRHDAGVHVTGIYDEGSGAGTAAHHDWSGAIVMGSGSKFKERFTEYLRKRDAGEATAADHQDFYDALSTLQHEVNHGVAARGPGKGGLAFQLSNYRQDWDRAMEEALTEESARVLTVEWMRAQGMTDALAAVKAMPKSDYRYVGSYTGPRAALRKLFDSAGVPEDERRELIMRMKFEMTPAERNRLLDEQIAARDETHARRLRQMPGGPSGVGHEAPYSPTKVIMGGGWRGRGPARGPDEFVPVIDDPLEDVEAAEITSKIGDGSEVRAGDRVLVGGPRAWAHMDDPDFWAEALHGEVVEVMANGQVKVLTSDGLALWYTPHRLKPATSREG